MRRSRASSSTRIRTSASSSTFLQRFTDGNLPAAFAAAPESWSPDQIEQFQDLLGRDDVRRPGPQASDPVDAARQQVRVVQREGLLGRLLAVPDAEDLRRITTSCPADLGFTENVNRSSGESQADVQHRVGDLPLMEHVEGILSTFLQDDLGLPLQVRVRPRRGAGRPARPGRGRPEVHGPGGGVPVRDPGDALRPDRTLCRSRGSFFTERAGPIPLDLADVGGRAGGPADRRAGAGCGAAASGVHRRGGRRHVAAADRGAAGGAGVRAVGPAARALAACRQGRRGRARHHQRDGDLRLRRPRRG